MLYEICENNFNKFERKISPILKKCKEYGVDLQPKMKPLISQGFS